MTRRIVTRQDGTRRVVEISRSGRVKADWPACDSCEGTGFGVQRPQGQYSAELLDDWRNKSDELGLVGWFGTIRHAMPREQVVAEMALVDCLNLWSWSPMRSWSVITSKSGRFMAEAAMEQAFATGLDDRAAMLRAVGKYADRAVPMRVIGT